MDFDVNGKYLWYILLVVILIASLGINLSVTIQGNLVFGDEGFYASRGKWTAQSLEMLNERKFRFSSPIYTKYFTRPPLFVFLISSLFMLGGELLVKTLMPIVSILTALMLFLLVREMFSVKAGVLSVFFFLAIPSLITYSVLLYTEVLGVLFVTSSAYFLYRYFETEKNMFLVLTAVMASFAALTEVSMVPIFLFVFAGLWIYKKKSWGFLKETAMILSVGFLILSPWILIHNYSLTGNPGYKLDRFIDFPSSTKISGDIPEVEDGSIGGERRGVKAGIVKMGVLNFIQFAYSLPIFIFAVLGMSYFAVKRNKKSLLVMFLLVYALTFTLAPRGEGGARNTLALVIPLSVASGLFSKEVYSYLKEFKSVGKFLAVLFIVILLGWGLFSASSKAESLRPKKEFSESFFEACDWIKENTDKDARILTLWGARASYNCNRASFWGAPEMQDAVAASSNKTYEVIKTHGISYVFIQKFSIKREGRNRYPIEFVRYLENSPRFEQVYSYPSQCLYRQKTVDCSVVYKVKEGPEKNQTQNIPQTLTNLQGGG